MGGFIHTFKKCKAPECQTEKIHIFMTHLMKHLEFAVIITVQLYIALVKHSIKTVTKRGGGSTVADRFDLRPGSGMYFSNLYL